MNLNFLYYQFSSQNVFKKFSDSCHWDFNLRFDGLKSSSYYSSFLLFFYKLLRFLLARCFHSRSSFRFWIPYFSASWSVLSIIRFLSKLTHCSFYKVLNLFCIPCISTYLDLLLICLYLARYSFVMCSGMGRFRWSFLKMLDLLIWKWVNHWILYPAVNLKGWSW